MGQGLLAEAARLDARRGRRQSRVAAPLRARAVSLPVCRGDTEEQRAQRLARLLPALQRLAQAARARLTEPPNVWQVYIFKYTVELYTSQCTCHTISAGASQIYVDVPDSEEMNNSDF